MIHTLPGNRSAVESRRQRLRGGQCPARNRNLLDVLRLQMDSRQLCHLPGAEDQDRPPLQVSENLFGECNRRIADRDGTFAESRLGPHPLADGERRVKQPVGERGGELPVARHCVGGLDLSKDLRLADDQRIESGGNAKEMAGGVCPAMNVEMLAHVLVRDLVILTEKAAEVLRRAVTVTHGVDLGPVAGRQDDQLASDPSRGELGKRVLQPLAREVHRLPQFDGCRPVTQSDCKEAHQGMWSSPASAGRYQAYALARRSPQQSSAQPR